MSAHIGTQWCGPWTTLDHPSQPGATGTFAAAILNVAAQVEAAECVIKAEIARAASAGDCARVNELMTAWANTPAVELAARIQAPTTQSTRT